MAPPREAATPEASTSGRPAGGGLLRRFWGSGTGRLHVGAAFVPEGAGGGPAGGRGAGAAGQSRHGADGGPRPVSGANLMLEDFAMCAPPPGAARRCAPMRPDGRPPRAQRAGAAGRWPPLRRSPAASVPPSRAPPSPAAATRRTWCPAAAAWRRCWRPARRAGSGGRTRRSTPTAPTGCRPPSWRGSWPRGGSWGSTTSTVRARSLLCTRARARERLSQRPPPALVRR